MKIYLDACILIYLVEGPVTNQAAILQAMTAAASPDFCISDLVRLECLVGPLRRTQASIVAHYEQAFTMLNVLPCLPAAFDCAAELRAHHGLKTPDALHAGAAITHRCDELWTNDHRLASIRSRIATRVPL
jgi:predicted nucleic acid-binding protein